jgi:hypothetical protein
VNGDYYKYKENYQKKKIIELFFFTKYFAYISRVINNNIKKIQMATEQQPIKQVKKPYEDLQMGFDRTQLFKEHQLPQLNRSTALQSVLSFCKLNQIQPTTQELFQMTERYVAYIETGDREWVKMVDNYIKSKYEEDNI